MAEAPMQVIAYVFPQDRVLQPGEIAAKKVTRINYAFANLKDGHVVEGFVHDTENFAALRALKKENPGLTVLVSVGGWTWSGRFSDMALTKASRKVFLDSAVAFVEKHQLDGLDIDWEYPGLVGNGNKFRATDKQNYTLLLKELRTRFDVEGKRLHRHLVTSIAVGGGGDFVEHTEMGEVQKYVDTVNLMSYDYYSPGGDKTTGNHAPLFVDPADPKKVSADDSVKTYLAAGVPKSKIVLGVPFYGKAWSQVGAAENGLFQPGKAAKEVFLNYGYIAENMMGKGFVRHWDDAAKAPYLYNAEKKLFVSYEDAESLAVKTKYVRSQGLAGVMFWEYTGDPNGVLLNAIDAGLGLGAQETSK